MNRKIETKSFNQESKTWEIQWEWKADQPQGVLHGWANLYEKAGKQGRVIDRGRDSIQRGALKGSVKIPILINHDITLPVGTGIAYEKSDSKGNYGIYIEIKLFLDSESQALRERALEAYELAKSGVLNKLSIGYVVHDYDIETAADKRAVRLIKQLELLETSLVVVPMNEHSVLESVKAQKETKRNEIITLLGKSYCTYGELEDSLCELYLNPEALMIEDYLKKACGRLKKTGVPHTDYRLIAREYHLRQYYLHMIEMVKNYRVQEFLADFINIAGLKFKNTV